MINFEVPNVAESYVHRIGRTARAGAQGIAISLSDAEERSFIRDIEKLIAQPIPVNREHPFHSNEVENSRVMSSGKAKAAIESQNRGGRGGGGGRGGQQRRRRPGGGSASGGSRPSASKPRGHH